MSLFNSGDFRLHSGDHSNFLIDCSALTIKDWRALAALVASHIKFRKVVGIPQGGLALAYALERYQSDEGPTLIVDDVLTTGASMEATREKVGEPVIGIVVFARGKCPGWVRPIFRLEEWCAKGEE